MNEEMQCDSDELPVTFALAGEYPWRFQNKQNVITKKFNTSNLTLKHYSTTANVITSAEAYHEHTKWFKPTRHGWKVALFCDPCNGCGSECCLYNNHKNAVQKLLQEISKKVYKQNSEKRHEA